MANSIMVQQVFLFLGLWCVFRRRRKITITSSSTCSMSSSINYSLLPMFVPTARRVFQATNFSFVHRKAGLQKAPTGGQGLLLLFRGHDRTV